MEPELISTNLHRPWSASSFRLEVSPDRRTAVDRRSLIITDESLSDETSDSGTDLVVTMR